MLYVVLGIIILIVSFVVALVSLIYEQRRVEELKNDENDNSLVETSELDLPDKSERPLQIPTIEEAEGKPSFNKVPESPAREDVWWNSLDEGRTNPDLNRPTEDEAESIRAIREELSRIAASKAGHNASVAVQEMEVVPDRNEVKKQRVLMGEFSLGDFRRSN